MSFFFLAEKKRCVRCTSMVRLRIANILTSIPLAALVRDAGQERWCAALGVPQGVLELKEHSAAPTQANCKAILRPRGTAAGEVWVWA